MDPVEVVISNADPTYYEVKVQALKLAIKFNHRHEHTASSAHWALLDARSFEEYLMEAVEE